MRHLLAAIAVTLPVLAFAGFVTYQPEPTYSLIGLDGIGGEYVLDTKQTLDDCERSTYAYDMRYPEKLCELEQRG